MNNPVPRPERQSGDNAPNETDSVHETAGEAFLRIGRAEDDEDEDDAT